MKYALGILLFLLNLTGLEAHAEDLPDITTIPQDLTTPPMTEEKPAPGKRVRQVLRDYKGSAVYHAFYLPVDWEPGGKFPVIAEYAGNKWRTSAGTVEGSCLGYGISGGEGCIWICLPFVDAGQGINALTWWGDVEATVDYCKKAVAEVCARYGGDASAVFLAGFSRGAIACNYIGLHDDEIASMWCGFICHSHYDGVKQWDYAGSDRTSAAKRLARLKNRPQFISHEISVGDTERYLAAACPGGDFTFMTLPYGNHTDTWTLRGIPERKKVRKWFLDVLRNRPKSQ